MLNIPTAVQDLFKTDGTWKSFLATFPNGDEGDIRNDRIVRESLKFTESACSDEVCRFGGCERSQIEFETVGVDNILGKTMDCYIEIDLSSLTVSEIAAIAADPGDGEYVPADPAISAPELYRVPLGRFLVTSCPRDRRASAHRQVTGMTPTYWRLSPIERAKLDWYSGRNGPKLDPERFMLANVGYWAPGFMESRGWTKAQDMAWSDFTQEGTQTTNRGYFRLLNGDVRYMTIRSTYRSAEALASKIRFQLGGLYAIDLGGLDLAGFRDFCDVWFGDVDWADTDLTYGFVQIRGMEDFLRYSMGASARACPCLVYWDPSPANMQAAALLQDVEVFDSAGILPDLDGRTIPNAYAGGRWLLTIPETVTITITDENDQELDSFTMGVGSDPPCIYKWSNPDTDARPTLALPVPASDEYKYSYDGDAYPYRQWTGSVDAADLIRGWLELNGKLLTPGRGVPRVVALEGGSPVQLSPADYSNVWWDDYLTEYIGRVLFTYGKDRDRAGEWLVGVGGSVYDLSDSELLAMMPINSAAKIRDAISSRMGAGLQALSIYSPAEISMPAWPWIESGDALEITTEDGKTVETFVMQRTISGTQMLWDEITAPGGDVEVDDDE